MLKFEAKMFFVMTFFSNQCYICVVFSEVVWLFALSFTFCYNSYKKIQRILSMKQKVLDNDLKMLSNYISSALKSLEIWAQVYEITNPITDFRAKNEKRLGKVYEWLVFLNMVFLAICAYNKSTITFNNDILLIALFSFFCFIFVFMILAYIQIGFVLVLRCYTITGYKSIWLFIIGSFIPQIFCAVCSLIYFFS